MLPNNTSNVERSCVASLEVTGAVGVSFVGAVPERHVNGRSEGERNPWSDGEERSGGHCYDAHDGLLVCIRLWEGGLTGEAFVEERPERPDIGAMVEGVQSLSLFG